jgi:hypothetical protein
LVVSSKSRPDVIFYIWLSFGVFTGLFQLADTLPILHPKYLGPVLLLLFLLLLLHSFPTGFSPVLFAFTAMIIGGLLCMLQASNTVLHSAQLSFVLVKRHGLAAIWISCGFVTIVVWFRLFWRQSEVLAASSLLFVVSSYFSWLA